MWGHVGEVAGGLPRPDAVPYSTAVQRKHHPRAFSLIEVMAVTAIIGVVVAVAVSLSSQTSQGLEDQHNQFSVLDYIQRERNAHVNRGMETEVLIICTASGGECAPSGSDLIAYRMARPATLPPPAATELSRQSFGGRLSFSGQFLIVDAFARSTTAVGDPVVATLTLTQKRNTETIVFRNDGAVVPTFDATAALVVAPKIADIGSRTTPNPTPFGSANGVPRARQVFLE